MIARAASRDSRMQCCPLFRAARGNQKLRPLRASDVPPSRARVRLRNLLSDLAHTALRARGTIHISRSTSHTSVRKHFVTLAKTSWCRRQRSRAHFARVLYRRAQSILADTTSRQHTIDRPDKREWCESCACAASQQKRVYATVDAHVCTLSSTNNVASFWLSLATRAVKISP